jgi:hypothetical protein
MRTFLVTFNKLVCDDTGHERCVVQQRAIVRALSEVSAVWQAKAMFCEALAIVDWRMRADSCELTEMAGMPA